MQLLRRLSWPIYLGFIVLATLPFILLFSASPWIFACLYFAAAAIVLFVHRVERRTARRSSPRAAAVVLFAAGVGLLLVDASGVLDPLVDPAGEMILDVDVSVSSDHVARGDTFVYHLSVTNDQFREARQRAFDVDETTIRGVLLYLELPREGSERLPLVEARAAATPDFILATVVYSESSPLVPVLWEWSTNQTSEDQVVAALSGDVTAGFDLAPGSSLELDVTIRVPESYEGSTVRAPKAVLSYEDPVPGAFTVQTLWFDVPTVSVTD